MPNNKSPADEAAEHRTLYRQRLMAEARQREILSALNARGTISAAGLAHALAVSVMTIRRDLIELEAAGKLTRIHGGAVAPEHGATVAMDSIEPSFEARLLLRNEAKQRIAIVAAAVASHYRSVALDVGTTTFLMAQRLVGCSRMKVFTNSVRIAHALNNTQPDVYLSGGRVRLDEMSMGGPTAVQRFAALWFDVAFIGVSGLTPDGIYDYSFEDAELKRVYLRCSDFTVVLCDCAKFQRMSLVHLSALDGINMLITEDAPPPSVAAALEAAKVQVVIAPPLARDC